MDSVHTIKKEGFLRLIVFTIVKIASTDKEIAPVEKGMHTNSFRYKKCTHFILGTGNVYLNPR